MRQAKSTPSLQGASFSMICVAYHACCVSCMLCVMHVLSIMQVLLYRVRHRLVAHGRRILCPQARAGHAGFGPRAKSALRKHSCTGVRCGEEGVASCMKANQQHAHHIHWIATRLTICASHYSCLTTVTEETPSISGMHIYFVSMLCHALPCCAGG